MNIIFAVKENNGWDSIISPVFGRANGFLKYAEETKTLSYISNKENNTAEHGAGIQAGQTAINLNGDMVITGGIIGPKALYVLQREKIKMITEVGEISIEEAYNNFKTEKYEIKS